MLKMLTAYTSELDDADIAVREIMNATGGFYAGRKKKSCSGG
jgi:hypothetical protein